MTDINQHYLTYYDITPITNIEGYLKVYWKYTHFEEYNAIRDIIFIGSTNTHLFCLKLHLITVELYKNYIYVLCKNTSLLSNSQLHPLNV